jgi:Tfp pilus assembly protein PilV
MSLAPCNKPARGQRVCGRGARFSSARQGGSVLLEALVAIVLSAAMGLGMAYGAAKALSSQRYASTQNMAVFGLRQALASAAYPTAAYNNAASNLPLALSSINAAGAAATASTNHVAYTKSCSQIAARVTAADLAAVTVYPYTCTLSTRSDPTSIAVLGGNGVLSFGP